jgi:DNA polymerase III epsilon subunit-like protein
MLHSTKYDIMIVADIETTGMSPKRNSIVSIGAVEFENPKNTFYGECRVEDGLPMDPVSFQINGFTLKQVTDRGKPEGKVLLKQFSAWVEKTEERTLAGDNIWFDTGFLKEKMRKSGIKWPFKGEPVELHEVSPISEGMPWSLDIMLRIVGIPERKGAHNALEDAMLTAEAISRIAFGKGLLKKYARHKVPDFIQDFLAIVSEVSKQS